MFWLRGKNLAVLIGEFLQALFESSAGPFPPFRQHLGLHFSQRPDRSFILFHSLPPAGRFYWENPPRSPAV
ncbi:MAG TPA: hypothetical protein PLX89_24380 [Verrucomicrobiota bacterium]|nr:hypothetical protein [Verrucomicrobiota bacterium]